MLFDGKDFSKWVKRNGKDEVKWTLKDGMMEVAQGPGFGLVLDDDLVRRYRVD